MADKEKNVDYRAFYTRLRKAASISSRLLDEAVFDCEGFLSEEERQGMNVGDDEILQRITELQYPEFSQPSRVNYAGLYTLLFNRITDALEELDQGKCGTAREILRTAQQEAEERYIDS